MWRVPSLTRYKGRTLLTQTRESSAHHFVKPEGSVELHELSDSSTLFQAAQNTMAMG